jgi:hypothetical protein
VDEQTMKGLVDRYIEAYNSFAVDQMVALMHTDCEPCFMSDPRTKTLQLIEATRGYLRTLGDRRLASFLTRWPPETAPFRNRPARRLPVLSFLPDATGAADPNTVDLVRLFEAANRHLRWGQTYSAAQIGAGFLEKYGWTELIGRRGPVAGRAMAVGVLLLGPDTEYPPHRHAAEEIYVPLTGPSLWMQGGDKWVARPSGEPIYHRPWLPHAMRTASAPLLALYLWRGHDLTRKSQLI